MNKTVLLLLAAFFISSAALNAESDFEKWKKQQQKAYKSYLSEQEKAFSEMLQKEWEEFQTKKGFIIDKTPKPDRQPQITVIDTPETDVPLQSETPVEPVYSSAQAAGSSSGQTKPEQQTKPSASSEVSDIGGKITQKPLTGLSSSAGTNQGSAPHGSVEHSKSAAGRQSVPKPSLEKKKDTKYLKIDFYGTVFSVPVPKKLKIKENISKLNNKEISDFFEYYSGQKMDSTILFIKFLDSEYNMNGWSVIKTAEKVSKRLYDSETDSVIMTWFLLVKSGYDVKIAYSSRNVFLLYLPEVKVYSVPYITENRKNYYFYNKSASANERIRTYSGNFVKKPSVISLFPENPAIFRPEAGSRNISFSYKRKKYPVSLGYNRSLINYYNEYPQVDISVYFIGSISDQALQSYKKSLYPYIKDMNEKDAVQFILSFVQNGFKYKTDGRQFGFEKPMFPDETLHYPFIDCEDRSALFISIVKELTGLDAVALDYPGHIAAAVNFRSTVKGDYFNYKGKKYTVCDPTYINASIGMTMPDYKKVKPVIIETGK